MIRKIVLSTLFALVVALLPATAASAADPVLPVESTLRTKPAALIWPSVTEFQYRLSVRSGPEGADFRFHFPIRPWGPDDVTGTPFTSGKASLDGPGDLQLESALVADPSPTACFRGGFGSSLNFYRLTLEPNSETVVTMPSRLTAAPVSGMDRSISAEINTTSVNPYPVVLTSPIEITGQEDVRIIGRIPGSTPSRTTALRPGESFRIAGRTVPRMKNQRLIFRAEQRMGFGSAVQSGPLTTVRTDGKGRFRTAPVTIRHAGSWVLTSRVSGAGRQSFSCNGAVEVGQMIQRATVRTLDGRNFVSTSIKGPGTKPKKIELSFFRGTTYDENFEVISRNGPIMILNAGCNRVGGGYEVRRGRLHWIGPVGATEMACPDDRTGWISSRLMKGVTAKFVGKTLVLRAKRGVRIALKPHK